MSNIGPRIRAHQLVPRAPVASLPLGSGLNPSSSGCDNLLHPFARPRELNSPRSLRRPGNPTMKRRELMKHTLAGHPICPVCDAA
jgi:hypothetical protein